MINLISIFGRSAKHFYIDPHLVPDFRSLLRTLTSGRVLMVATKFRSDLFFNSDKPRFEEILKFWALYAEQDISHLDQSELTTSRGGEQSLSTYFYSINLLSTNWYYYRIYRNAFSSMVGYEQSNDIARTIVQCDQFLVENTRIERKPLIQSDQKIRSRLTNDTLSLARNVLNSSKHFN